MYQICRIQPETRQQLSYPSPFTWELPPLECLLPRNFLNDYGGAFRIKAVLLKRYSASREPFPARRPAHTLVFRQVTSGQQAKWSRMLNWKML